jgi:hypothetical protein
MRSLDVVLFLTCVLSVGAQVRPEPQISGPYTHDNLAVFLIRANGDNSGQGHPQVPVKIGEWASIAHYLTLQQAMEQRKVVVYETKQVNELAVENVSTEPVFIQDGDVVKGGAQDRMISNDFVLPPKSGRRPVAAFCVERGRWSQRGTESAAKFESSTGLAPLRFEARAMWNQMSVWGAVEELQAALAAHLHKSEATGLSSVRAPASPTSLALTQSSKPVQESVGSYIRALSRVGSGKAGVVGFAFAVNGQVKSADLYASPELFAAIWPKLLSASALEAVQHRESGKVVAVPPTQVLAFLRDAAKGKQSTTDVDGKVKLVKRESEKQMQVESWDGARWVHRSVITK